MTCHEMEQLLDEWVDGVLPEATRREVQDHLAGCGSCRAHEGTLREVLTHAAALPRSLSPPRDLWPGIVSRIERRRTWSWAVLGGWPPALAVAATVIMALAAVLLGRPSQAPVHTVVIPSPSDSGESRARPASIKEDPDLAAIEREYQVAASALMSALEKRQDKLEPETLARVQGNLAVIDEELQQIRKALKQDPSRPELERMLLSTHRKRVDALRQMVKLSTAL